jgi:Protein O-mannosyl-transferase TMEM260-like
MGTYSAKLSRLLARINPDVVLAITCFVVTFALYARTVAPGVLDDDGGEFQTNIYRLGVSHTGYPLFFLLAKLWTLLLPIGSIAYRANLFSALFGALTVVLVYATMRTLVTSRGAALVTALLLTVSRVEWSQSIIPRVYTLNSFFVVLLVLLAALYLSGRISAWWLVFAFGLSLTNHRTMMWFGPALALIILIREGRALWQPRRLLWLTVAFILPLLLYLYIPLRGDSDVGVEYHASNFKDMILAGNASLWLRFGPPGFLWSRLVAFYLPLQIEQFSLVGFAFGLLGFAALALKRMPRGLTATLAPRQFLLLLGVAFLFETAFGIVFVTLDSEKYFLPSYLIFLIAIGLGLALTFDWLASLRFDAARRALPLVFAAGLLALCVNLGSVNFPSNNQSNNDDVETRWNQIFSQPLEKNALLIGNWESLAPLEYYQYVDQTRTDLKRFKAIIYRDQLKLAPQGDLTGMIQRALDGGQAVYLTLHPSQTETLGYLSQRFDLVPIASLWRVQPLTASPPAVTLNARFGDALALQSIALNRNARAGAFVPFALTWQVAEPLDHNYRFSLQLYDASHTTWMQRQVIPLGGLGPTPEWQSGNGLRDEEGFFVPPDAPPGDYALELSVYDAGTRMPLKVGEATALTLATIHVTATVSTLPREAYHIPHPLDWAMNGATLIGYGLSAEVLRGGDPVELDTWWDGLAANQELQIEFVDARGVSTNLYQGELLQNVRGKLKPRQIVLARHTLLLPPVAAAGRATLRLVMQGQSFDLAQLNLLPSDRQFSAPHVEHAQPATLGSAIEFLGYDLKRSGNQLQVTLYWHAQQPPPASYKVFVHLLDANGVLRAQQDSIPRGGDLPTDRWLAGEYVTDDYTVALPGGLAPGDYRVEIGMYSPDTLVRVAAVDGSGAPLPDNRVLLNTVVPISK